jgi:hypothetical protein
MDFNEWMTTFGIILGWVVFVGFSLGLFLKIIKWMV